MKSTISEGIYIGNPALLMKDRKSIDAKI
jgi:hypothetical protein